MRNASAGLKTFLATVTVDEFMCADLYTFTLVDGTIIRLTTWQTDLTVGGNTFAATPFISRGKITTVIGMEVAQLDVTICADITDTITPNATPMLQAIQQGRFDGATVLLERLVMPTLGDVTTYPTVIWFKGEIGSPDVDRLYARLTVYGMTNKLNIAVPRQLLQPSCYHFLFDSGCTLVKSSFKTSKIVLAGSTIWKITPSVAFAQAAGYFDLGTIEFTSGQNNGVKRTVKLHASGDINLILPLMFAPIAGDTFDVYPGCDKLKATCNTKFSNLVNFGGQPFIPKPEAVL